MSFRVYPTKAAAEADLDRVNVAYVQNVTETKGGVPQQTRVTQRWADVFECAEGFAFTCPPACVNVAISGAVHESVTVHDPIE